MIFWYSIRVLKSLLLLEDPSMLTQNQDKILVLVGEKKAVSLAIKNNKAVNRNTRLKERIRKVTIG